jgi:hypothetical protein
VKAWEEVLKSLHDLHEKVDRIEAKLGERRPAEPADPVGDAVKADAARAQGSPTP